jgi:hypothetical protein
MALAAAINLTRYYSFKLEVWGWIMHHKGLAAKTWLHKVGVTNISCTTYGRDEMVEHVI